MLSDGNLETTIQCKFAYYGALPNTDEAAALPNEPVLEVQTARGKTKRERDAAIAQDALNQLGLGGPPDADSLTEALANAPLDELSELTRHETDQAGGLGTRDTGAYGTQQDVIGTGQLGSGNAMGTQGQSETADLGGDVQRSVEKQGSLSLGNADGRQGETGDGE